MCHGALAQPGRALRSQRRGDRFKSGRFHVSYRDDPEARREYQRLYNQRHRLRGIELLGGQCTICGNLDDAELIFRYKDWQEEAGHIPVLNWGIAWKRLVDMMAHDYDLICRGCRSQELADAVPHGSDTKYSDHGCRCDECKAAHAAYNLPYSRARKKRLKAMGH